MTKSELIQALYKGQNHLSIKDVELAAKCVLDAMTQGLVDGDRIEIRGFGSFSLHYRKPRVGRNPRTGGAVEVPSKFVAHFKPGSELRDRVDSASG